MGAFSGLLQMGMAMKGEAAEAEALQLEAFQNKRLADQAAADATERGNREAEEIRRKGLQTVEAQKVAYANSGVDPTQGTPLNVMADTRMMSELDARTALNNAAREAWGYKTHGLRYEQQASLSAQRSKNRQLGTALGGVGQVVKGYGEYF